MQLVIALVAFWSLAGFITVRAVNSQLSERIDNDLVAESRSIATVFELLDEELIDDLADEFAVGGRESALIVVDANGPVFTLRSGTADDPQPLPDIGDLTVGELRGRSGVLFTVDDVGGNEDRYRVITVPLATGEVAVIARSRASLEQVNDILGTAASIALVVAVAGVCLLVWLISRSAMKPLEDVIGTAHAIGAGTLDTRVEVRSTARDVERLADALNTMLGRLQEAFAAKELSEARLRQFVADASHELRTPLAAVIGYAELYQQNMARSPEQIDNVMRRIVAEGGRMRTLVEDLLLLARLDEGRPLASDAVDVRELVSDALATIRVIAPDRTFVVVASSDERPAVRGDDIAIRQILDNLLMNTVVHTPDGTTTTVGVATDGDDAVVTVSDDGQGMSGDEVVHAFDRFWRAEKSRVRPGGNGLGLAIVADLVRAHGGTIRVDSAVDVGTTFTITIPRLP